MSLLGPITTPLRSLLFALGGAVLAWAWFNSHPALPIAVVVLAWAITIAVQAYAESRIIDDPVQALKLLEWRLLGIVVVSAGAAALVIIVTVWFTLDEQEAKELPTSTQEVLAAVSAALIAFIGAVSVSAESADENVGELVKTKFREKFVMTPDENGTAVSPGPGQKVIDVTTSEGRRADRALNSSHDYGWTDWSKDTRRARAQAIKDAL